MALRLPMITEGNLTGCPGALTGWLPCERGETPFCQRLGDSAGYRRAGVAQRDREARRRARNAVGSSRSAPALARRVRRSEAALMLNHPVWPPRAAPSGSIPPVHRKFTE